MTLHTTFGNFILHTNVDFYGTPNMELDRITSDDDTRVTSDGDTRIVLDAGSAVMLHTQVQNFILHTEIE